MKRELHSSSEHTTDGLCAEAGRKGDGQALLLGLKLIPLALMFACAGNTGVQVLPPQTVTTAASNDGSEPGQSPVLLTPPTPDVVLKPEPKPEPTDKAKLDDGSLVVIATGDRAPGVTTRRDLVMAARRESERRKNTQPIAVIDDDNLAEHAEGGNLTVGNPRASTTVELEEARSTLDQRLQDEEYWRARARGIRQRWRTAYDSFEKIETQASVLRRRFYSEENVELRDREIQPAWEDAKKLLKEVKEDIGNVKKELDSLYLDGRRAGALEGWLREGIELEPWDGIDLKVP